MTRWNTVRDSRRAWWENHLIGELRRIEAQFTAALIQNPNYKLQFDLSGVEVLGESRFDDASTADKLALAAERMKSVGVMTDEEIKEWFMEFLPKAK